MFTDTPSPNQIAARATAATAPLPGSAGDSTIALDLGRLLATHLLIQTAPDGGELPVLRQILENTHGQVQQLVVDPAAELALLAKHYDYLVCAPDGGDARVTPDNGAALARTVFLSGRSAIFAIGALGLDGMRQFTAALIADLLALPPESWHPALLVIDEAQLFAPAYDVAESRKPLLDLATKGRKRGLGLVLTTRRIALLDRRVVSRMTHRLIGPTTQETAVARATGDSARSPDVVATRTRTEASGRGSFARVREAASAAACPQRDPPVAPEPAFPAAATDDGVIDTAADEAGVRRFRAIQPLLGRPGGRRAAIERRARELGVGVSTLYRWLQRYDPERGAQSLSAARRHSAIRGCAGRAGANGETETGREGEAGEPATEIRQACYWLSVETADNWIADKVARFTLLGIAEAKARIAETMQAGDRILTYVKGRGFADVRRVARRGAVALAGRVAYSDGVFARAIETEAVRVLPFAQHVPVAAMAAQLELCRHCSHWKHAFRHTLRKLDARDGTLIEQAILSRPA